MFEGIPFSRFCKVLYEVSVLKMLRERFDAKKQLTHCVSLLSAISKISEKSVKHRVL